jgi:hypothetical protein
MSTFTYAAVPNLVRQELYQGSLEKQFDDWLIGRPLFDDKTGIFPDGDSLDVTLTADRDVADYTENTQITYDGMTTSRASLTVTAYKQDGFFVTDRMKQDAHQSEAFFQENVHKSGIAMATDMETACLATANSQTLGADNAVNGASHRFQGGGTGGALTIDDIMYVKYSFDKAYVPTENRVLIVTPEMEYELNKLLNITEVSNGSNFNFDVQGLVQTGFGDKLNIVRNIAGINIMVSHNLPAITAETLALSGGTGGGAITGTGCIAMSMANDTSMPFMGVVRQRPETEFFRNTNLKRDEWSATCRYGFALKRPETLITIATPI